jgi:hypothetical protein
LHKGDIEVPAAATEVEHGDIEPKAAIAETAEEKKAL